MTDTKLTAEQAVEEICKRINTENYTVFYHDVMRILSRVQQGEVPADLEQRAREAHAQLNDLMMHFAERERLWPPVVAKTADVHAAIDTLAAQVEEQLLHTAAKGFKDGTIAVRHAFFCDLHRPLPERLNEVIQECYVCRESHEPQAQDAGEKHET